MYNNLINGKIEMPKITKLKEVYGEKVYREIEQMFEAMWYSYLTKGIKGNISLPYWFKRINDVKATNIALKLLSEKGWVTVISNPNRNWGEAYLNEFKLLEYVSEKQLAQIRLDNKFNKYVLNKEEEATQNNRVRANGKTTKSGLVREGFRKASNVEFEFDTTMMAKYKDEVIELVNKGIEKMALKHSSIKDDLANYANTGTEVVESYIYNDQAYTAGQNSIDWRGRNIK